MIGLEFSHYRVEERLGRGGMGTVYRGWDTLIGRPVALKVVRSDRLDDTDSRRQLLREARAAMSVVHENVCPVYGVEELPDGQLCIAMGYCEGRTLRQRLSAADLGWHERLRVAAEIAAGLGAAHAAGVIHRDIKPGNIMITEAGTARLLDFGVAGRIAGTHSGDSSRGPAGTPAFMAPEVLSGGKASFRSDVFSLGVVLWMLFTGSHPFGKEGDSGLIARMAHEPPHMDSAVRESLPPALVQLLERLLHKDPQRRPADATEIVGSLRAQLRQLETMEEADTTRVLDLARGRPKLRLGGFVLLLVAVGVVFGLSKVEGLWWADRPSVGLGIVAPRDAEGSTLTEGLATALGWELAERRNENSSYWVVPWEWNDEVGAWSQRHAAELLGVPQIVTVEPAGSGGVLLSFHAGEGATARTARFDDVPTMAVVLETLRGWGVEVGPEPPRHEPASPRLYYRGLAHLRRATAEGDSSVMLLDRATRRDAVPSTRSALAEALRRRARLVQHDDSDAARATALLDSLFERGALPVFGRVCRGRLALDAGDPLEAERWLRSASLHSHGDFQALRYLGRAYELQEEFGEEARVRRETIRRWPDFVGARERMALHLYGRGLYREAWEHLVSAASLAPAYGYSFNLLGVCAVELGCWEDAVTCFERSLRFGRSSHATANLGFLYYNLGEYEQAVSMYRWAANDFPDDHRTWGALAASLWWSGEKEEAIESYRKAARMAEREVREGVPQPELQLDLAGYYSLWDPDRARAALALGEANLPADSGPGFLSAAAVHAALGEVEPALQALRRALSLGVHPRRLAGSPFLSSLRDSPGYHHLIRPAESTDIPCPPLPADPGDSFQPRGSS